MDVPTRTGAAATHDWFDTPAAPLPDDQLAAARQRAAEAEALSGLLAGVVLATRELLDADDFAAGLNAWLARLGQAAGADVAVLIENFESPGQPTVARWRAMWRRHATAGVVGPIPATSDFIDWQRRLNAGETIWAHIDELRDPASVQFWRDTDCQTNLLVPIVLNGRAPYVLCFDWHLRQAWQPAYGTVLRTAADSLAAVLQRQAAAQALASEREARIEAERRRADEAAAHAARIERHSRLLAAVAESAEELLAARDLCATLGAVLQRIGQVMQAERAGIAQVHWTPHDPALRGWQQVTHEWTRAGRVRQLDSPAARIDMYRDDPTWERMLEQFRTHGRAVLQPEGLGEPCCSARALLGPAWTVCHPVLLDDAIVGVAFFDFPTPFQDSDAAELAALRTVASAMSDAMGRRALEQRTLHAEQQRSAALARVSESLRRTAQHVAEGVSLERVLGAALLEVAGISGARTAAVHRVERSGQVLQLMACVTAGQPLDLATDLRVRAWCQPVPLTRALPWLVRLSNDEFRVQRLAGEDGLSFDPAALEAHRSFGHSHLLQVPLYAGDELVGVMSLCFTADPEPAGLHADHARAVGHLMATALQMAQLSEAARRALLAGERERLQRERAAELARANEMLRSAMAALPGDADGHSFLATALTEIVAQSGAWMGHLFRFDEDSGLMRLVGSSHQGRWSPEGEADDPPHFRSGYRPLEPAMAQLMAKRRVQWVDIADGTRRDFMLPATHAWHQRQNHQAAAFQVLAVGPRLVGLVGMTFRDATPPPEVQLERVHALGQPMALALELARLAQLARRSAEQAAVMGERNRLAREIHDGIAQSFLAIGMQLEAATPPADGATAAAMQQARELAAHGLAEARRAVAALRPYELGKRSLPAALRELLAKRLAGSGLQLALELPPAWQALPPEAEDHLFRIAQEAVNNVLLHAAASTLRVELSQAAGETTLLVADDGRGFDTQSVRDGAFGLEGMRQRTRLLGAGLTLLSQPGRGTEVMVSWAPA